MSKINLVIPAAGEATRLRPLTNNTSKIMVRVNGKPTLDYILEEASKSADLEQIVIVDGKFDDIREYSKNKNYDITFVKQEALLGPRHAIELGVDVLTDPSLPLVVWLGDAIILENNPLNLGTDFLLTKNDVIDQSAWCMWSKSSPLEFHNKPLSPIPNAVALVGLYSFADGRSAKLAFDNTITSYDISDALIEYQRLTDRVFANVDTKNWYDIGELSTYYETCGRLLTHKARAFNSIEFDSELLAIKKIPDFHSAHACSSISAEIGWYNSLTYEQQMFVPKIFPKTSGSLIMSYEAGTLVSDILLYENLSDTTIEFLIDKIFRIKLNYFNNDCEDIEFIQDFSNQAHKMWIEKTSARLQARGRFGTNELIEKAKKAAHEIVRKTRPISGMHGDLHTGNILFDFTRNKITLIDPRGLYGSFLGTTFGDNIYDWAKLAHDLYYGYNAAVANVEHKKIVREIFLRKLYEYQISNIDSILAGGRLLILTCIPLHFDDDARQERLFNLIKDEF